MNTGIERAANVIGSIGILACLALQALQSFVFAPLSGEMGSYFHAVLGLFVFMPTLATLSFLSWRRLAAVGSILYAGSFTWLWWRFMCKRTFVSLISYGLSFPPFCLPWQSALGQSPTSLNVPDQRLCTNRIHVPAKSHFGVFLPAGPIQDEVTENPVSRELALNCGNDRRGRHARPRPSDAKRVITHRPFGE